MLSNIFFNKPFKGQIVFKIAMKLLNHKLSLTRENSSLWVLSDPWTTYDSSEKKFRKYYALSEYI
ncbi:hypothetical protein BpHYR1_023318 [Brachionus plicatilis]|uniref:Uncharacterized protein n=1 Tax=Brachionus plicatilis TaxID=10195 RepID=A0A3M7RPT4_BRAPC|nr:hypothetical protein BpHYR1_023318 [Brachionus plicatilis]